MAALYDLAPVWRVMLMGVVVALGPLSWIWLRQRDADLRRRLALLAGLTVFLTFDLVLFGAFTRLTDSGLGCPDWPGCYGHASPVGAHAAIQAAELALPTGPVTVSKAWVEMVHRYLATAVGVLIVVMAAASWLERKRLTVPLFWPLLTLAWVCLQGAFGALTVTMRLFPAIVTLHLLFGIGLVALLRVQAVRYGVARFAALDAALWQPAVRRTVWWLFGLVWLQIALGGWVSTNYAVLACTDFPQCQGSWWPTMDLRAGFQLWRGLGMQASGEGLPFAALTGIHYMHRLMAYAVLSSLLWVGVRWLRSPGRQSAGRWLLALAAWQLLSGLSNVVLDWPLVSAVAHTGGATAMVFVLTGWLTQLHSVSSLDRRSTPVSTPATA